MPVIKSAIKKLRKDRVRTKRNNLFRKQLDMAVRAAKKAKNAKSVSSAVSLIDRAVKNNLLPKNRAARMKSSLSKLGKGAKSTSSKVETQKSDKKTVSKSKKINKSTKK